MLYYNNIDRISKENGRTVKKTPLKIHIEKTLQLHCQERLCGISNLFVRGINVVFTFIRQLNLHLLVYYSCIT